MMKRTVTAVLAGALASGLLAAGTAAAQDVKIGALMPLTGDLQAYGESSFNGVKLAVEEINAQGGVLGGRNLAIAVGDTQTQAQAGIDAAQKLVSVENVTGIVGALSSGVSGPVATSVTSQTGVLQISSASTAPLLSEIADNDFFFRTVPHDALQGVVLAQIAREQGLEKVATLYVNNDYGDGLASSFKTAFEKAGGSVPASLAFEPGNASYRGELQRAAENDAEALLLIAYPENGVTILRQALEGGFFSKFVFTDGMKAPEIIGAIGAQYLEGAFGTAPQAIADSPAAENFKAAYEKAFGELPPKPFIDSAYDATFLLALAIEKAGSTDRVAVRDALRAVANPPGEQILPGEWTKAREALAAGKDIDYVGAAGSQDFDALGDVPGTYAFWQIKDGEIVTVDIRTPKS